MLRKSYRLPRKKIVFSNTIQNPYCTIKASKNGEIGSRFGIVVSKRVEKKAVGRNRIKRKLRKFIEMDRERLLQGMDFLFIIRKNWLAEEEKAVKTVQESLRKEGFYQ